MGGKWGSVSEANLAGDPQHDGKLQNAVAFKASIEFRREHADFGNPLLFHVGLGMQGLIRFVANKWGVLFRGPFLGEPSKQPLAGQGAQ